MMLRVFVPVVLAVAVFAPVALAQTVQLADGRVLVAEVDGSSVTGEGLRVKRLDNGGVLDLRWEQLSAASALQWKKKFDLVGEAQEEVMVRADHVDYSVGGTRQSVIGRVVARTADALTVQCKGVQYTIKKTDLLGMRTVDAPVTQVLTKDEFHTEQVDQVQPGGDADRHVLVAETMLRVGDYDHALEHVTKAKELGNSKNPAQIDTLAAKVQRYKEAAKELKLLEDIRATRSRGGLADFAAGVKLIEQYEKEYPAQQAKLLSEFKSEKARFGKAREYFLTGQVAEKWRESIRYVVEKALSDQSLSIQAARDFAQNKMTDEIVARLVAQMKLDANEIKQLWSNRKATPIGRRTEHFTYGVGSWVLGKESILKNTEQGKAGDKGAKQPPAAGGGNTQVNDYIKKLKEAMERRRQAVQTQGGEKDQSEDSWWKQADRAERITWLRAFYAENGGQLQVNFATVSPCLSCFGEGSLMEFGNDGKPVRNTCFLCQGTKWVRSFTAY